MNHEQRPAANGFEVWEATLINALQKNLKGGGRRLKNHAALRKGITQSMLTIQLALHSRSDPQLSGVPKAIHLMGEVFGELR